MTDISKRDNSDDASMIRSHNDINAHILGGGNVSHILNVKINEPTTNDIANQIRQQVFHKINNVPITFNINQLDVVITWRSNDNSHYYHADVMGIYGDVAVKLHTEMLLKTFNEFVDYDNNNCLDGTRLAFIVNKPLVRTTPI
jgi:hypothetical protein